MKKMKSRLFLIMLCMTVFLLQLAVPVQAASYDPETKTNLSIEYAYDGHAISGAKFDLYYVASRPSASGYTISVPFSSYPVMISGTNTSDWGDIALTLKGYALRDGLTPVASGVTGSTGVLPQKSCIRTVSGRWQQSCERREDIYL